MCDDDMRSAFEACTQTALARLAAQLKQHVHRTAAACASQLAIACSCQSGLCKPASVVPCCALGSTDPTLTDMQHSKLNVPMSATWSHPVTGSRCSIDRLCAAQQQRVQGTQYCTTRCIMHCFAHDRWALPAGIDVQH